MSKFLNLYNLIMEELTKKQKKLVDSYTKKRKNLSWRNYV